MWSGEAKFHYKPAISVSSLRKPGSEAGISLYYCYYASNYKDRKKQKS